MFHIHISYILYNFHDKSFKMNTIQHSVQYMWRLRKLINHIIIIITINQTIGIILYYFIYIFFCWEIIKLPHDKHFFIFITWKREITQYILLIKMCMFSSKWCHDDNICQRDNMKNIVITFSGVYFHLLYLWIEWRKG